MKKNIRILIVDDHFVVRVGLVGSISLEPDMVVTGEAASGPQAIAYYRQQRPDLVLMDLHLPGLSGVATTRAICQEFPGALIIMMSTYDGEEDIYQSIQAGARSYLLKTAERAEFIQTIRAVYAGERAIAPAIGARLAERLSRPGLTPHELDLLKLIAQGKSNHEIGRALKIAEATVQLHVGFLLAKLQVNDRTQAITTALHRGILHLE